MEEIRIKYTRLKYLLSEIDQKIDDLGDNERFSKVLEHIKLELEEIQVLQKDLKLGTGFVDLTNNQDFKDQAKLIHFKFDNIIRIKKLEMLNIQTRLRNLQNSKKLATYNRE